MCCHCHLEQLVQFVSMCSMLFFKQVSCIFCLTKLTSIHRTVWPSFPQVSLPLLSHQIYGPDLLTCLSVCLSLSLCLSVSILQMPQSLHVSSHFCLSASVSVSLTCLTYHTQLMNCGPDPLVSLRVWLCLVSMYRGCTATLWCKCIHGSSPYRSAQLYSVLSGHS